MSGNDRDGTRPRPARILPRDGRTAILVGRDAARWTDLCHVLPTSPWWPFLGAMALAYVAASALFALPYLLDPGGAVNARPGSFRDAFLFSVQTIGTLGYGVMAPQSVHAHAVVTIETSFGLHLALGTGLLRALLAAGFTAAPACPRHRRGDPAAPGRHRPDAPLAAAGGRRGGLWLRPARPCGLQA